MKASQTKVDRRKFLAGVAVAGATAASIKQRKGSTDTGRWRPIARRAAADRA